jgi:hypothetical protein
MSCPICLSEIKDNFEFKLCRHTCCRPCARRIKEFSFPTCPVCRSDINLQYISLNKKRTLVDKGINPQKVTKKEVMLFTILSQEATKREESNYTEDTDSDDD